VTKHVTVDAFKKPPLDVAEQARMIVQGDGQLCLSSHYAAIVEAQRDVEVYQLGDVDSSCCLRRMAEKHEALAEVFRARLDALETPVRRCHMFSTPCINPALCDAASATYGMPTCCAGDPNCVPPGHEETP
jgi:hypothetical protein